MPKCSSKESIFSFRAFAEMEKNRVKSLLCGCVFGGLNDKLSADKPFQVRLKLAE